eukprot:1799707-Pyramimonas_sp.AAC.1
MAPPDDLAGEAREPLEQQDLTRKIMFEALLEKSVKLERVIKAIGVPQQRCRHSYSGPASTDSPRWAPKSPTRKHDDPPMAISHFPAP